MPTIKQLPSTVQVHPEDKIPVSQAGETKSATVSALLTGVQPAIITETGTLLGRTSIGPGGPEPVEIGTGLALFDSGLAATGADHASFVVQNAFQPSDDVILNSAGAPRRMPMRLLRGLFSAGSNVSIDPNGVISATGGGAGATPGPQGPVGPQGPAGARGPAGPSAASVSTGAGAPTDLLGANGDGYVNATNGDVYAKANGIWSKIGI